jgi:Domain of unknown function (DUF4304)
MQEALKAVVLPVLRSKSFKGSLPHFRRVEPKSAHFLTFQFNSAGGSFVVEIARSGPNGIESGYGSDVPISKLTTHYFSIRHRLGSGLASRGGDHWYTFAPRNYEPPVPVFPKSHYEHVALLVVAHLESEADAWWRRSES